MPKRDYRQWRWLLVSLIVLMADQISKSEAVAYLHLVGQSHQLFPFLSFTLAHNPGAAFSFLGHAGGWQRWFFIVLTIIVCLLLIIWLRGVPLSQKLSPFALSLVIGGAVGNLCDRITLGYVNDFIDFHLGTWHYPTFNLADSAISVGVVLLLLSLLFERKHGQ